MRNRKCHNTNQIDLSDQDFNVVEQYGLTLTDFSRIAKRLEVKFNFSFKPSLFDSINPPGKIHMPHSYVSFVYYCNALDEEGVETSNLIKEFIDAQRGGFTEIRHASSLARLGFILRSKGYRVAF